MPAQLDMIIWRSRFRTVDSDLAVCSAMATKDRLVAATGDDDTIRAMRDPGTRMVDGRIVYEARER